MNLAYLCVLGVYIIHVFAQDDTLVISNSPSNQSDIHPSCTAFVKEFGLRSSRFIKCSVENAVPFRFCEGCVTHYERSKTVFQDILHSDEKSGNCSKELLSADRVQVISSIQKDIDKIWSNADCNECFSHISEDDNGTVHSTLTEKTQQFVQQYNNFTQCIKTNETGNTSVCDVCNQFYTDMNDMYDRLISDAISPQHVCMDIVDMMNYSRITWGHDLKCSKVHKEYAAVLAIAIGFLLIPPIFYGGLAIAATKRTRNILKAKRLSIFQRNTSYGTLDSPGFTSETQQQEYDNESPDSANQSAVSNISSESDRLLGVTNRGSEQ